MIKNFFNIINKYNCKISAAVSEFGGASLTKKQPAQILDCGSYRVTSGCGEWKVTFEINGFDDDKNVYDISVCYEIICGKCSNACLNMNFCFDDWSQNNYVIMPGAVYNGNRFECRELEYPPMLEDEDFGVNLPTLITDVPRLNINEGPSHIQLLAGDMSTPAIGIFSPAKSMGFWLYTEQSTTCGDNGLYISESDNRRQAVITVAAPGVRDGWKYRICSTKIPSEDRGNDFRQGDVVKLHMRACIFECHDIKSLLSSFIEMRKDMWPSSVIINQLPFSRGFKIIEEKQNRQNWREDEGYYSSGLIGIDAIYAWWQTGWVGGMMITLPFIIEGEEISKKRALRNFGFFFDKLQSKAGFFYGIHAYGKCYGDRFGYHDAKSWLLVRKNGDAVYFIIRQLMILKETDISLEILQNWINRTLACADAFVKLWIKYKQFGQFINADTGEILIGGSTSASTVPAALCMAWKMTGCADYLITAKESSRMLYDNFVEKGYTTGAPGEICQCPDSESAFGLLESLITIYEETGWDNWLEMAVHTANLCLTWCVPYNFSFPYGSTFGRLEMRTLGAVYANVQNKHGAPGICTFSGVSLFKLFRATGNMHYLDQIAETAHNIFQYISRIERPIDKMQPGWVDERVEMSDWLEPVGEVGNGSTWAEVSALLTYIEVPGIYFQTDTGLLRVFDHVDVTIDKSYGSYILKVGNRTRYPAVINLFYERSTDMVKVIGYNPWKVYKKITVKPSEETIIKVEENTTSW